MKLKELAEKYGEYEIYPDSPKHIEGAFKDLDSKDDGVLCLCVKKPKPKTIWDLKEGDTYFCVNPSQADWFKSMWTNGKIDTNRLEMGALFLTEEEAEKEVERQKVEVLLLKYGGRRWFKCDIANWVIRYNHLRSSFEYGYTKCTQHQSCIYFDTKEQAEKAIQEIGEDRVFKALFEVR